MDDDPEADPNAALRRTAELARRALDASAQIQQELDTLVQVLGFTGTIKPAHVELLKRASRSTTAALTPPIELSGVTDKYEIVGDDIDCAARLHLCKARCCSFGVKLSRQDLEEGEVQWEIDHPYRLPRRDDGYCMYLARTGERAGGCTNYQHRPATCRSYSCRDDARVWIDFEAMIPAPMPDAVTPLVTIRAK